MEIHYSAQFGKNYRKLSVELKKKAEKREVVFRKNPFQAQLKTHKLHGKLRDRWSFSIDKRYRIVFRFMEKDIVLFIDVGDHSVYQ